MKRVKLIHWKEEEARERSERIRKCGYEVDYAQLVDQTTFRTLRNDPPDAIVIDLSRLPSQGRSVAAEIRKSKATRHLPIVFLGGDPDKLARIREVVPDAIYSTWGRVLSALQRAIANPPQDPVFQREGIAGYSGTPLLKKLGIKSGTVVALVDAPPGFEDTLGELPDNVTLRRGARGRRDLTIWFVKSIQELEDRIDRLADQVRQGGLWIAWPKKASGVKTDVTQNMVRKLGLAAGLVDYKICAIDETWSGLKFSRRKNV